MQTVNNPRLKNSPIINFATDWLLPWNILGFSALPLGMLFSKVLKIVSQLMELVGSCRMVQAPEFTKDYQSHDVNSSMLDGLMGTQTEVQKKKIKLVTVSKSS